MKVFESFILHLTLKYIFRQSFRTFLKCSFSLTHCRVNLYSLSFAKIVKLSGKICLLFRRKLFSVRFFSNHSQKCTNRSFGTFCFHSFWRLRFYQKSVVELVDTLHRLASLLTYTMSIHQISFLNLANAFILLVLRVVGVNFMYHGFE